eukprot:2622584-Amphidinium_carterae.3
MEMTLFLGLLGTYHKEIRLQQRDESDEPLEASPILADERPPQAFPCTNHLDAVNVPLRRTDSPSTVSC